MLHRTDRTHFCVSLQKHQFASTSSSHPIPTHLHTTITMMNVEEEVDKLKQEIQRLGELQQDGSYKVKFGVLFNDDRCANIFEALVGTLRAAKKRKIVGYDGELLLQGVHDNVVITLVAPSDSAAPVTAS